MFCSQDTLLVMFTFAVNLTDVRLTEQRINDLKDFSDWEAEVEEEQETIHDEM